MKFFAPFIATIFFVAGQPQAAEFTFSAFHDQNPQTPWPTQEWPRSPLPSTADTATIHRIADTLMANDQVEALGLSHALVIVQEGRIVYERYAEGYSCDGIAHTMSIAKMMGATIAGVMHGDGMIDIEAPADIPAWHKKKADPRGAITHAHILQMTSGLQWNEMMDLLGMAFGGGYEDIAQYVIDKPLAYPPGTHFQYSDGAPGLIGYILRNKLDGGADEVAAFFNDRILHPLGMINTEAEFDKKGTWYGASGIRWSPCDLARFSHFLLRDGVWEEARILPDGWVDYMRSPTPASIAPGAELRTYRKAGYGLATFVYDIDFETDVIDLDSFGHVGFGGSVLKIIPTKDAAILLYGAKAFDEAFTRRIDFVHELGAALPEPKQASPSP
ncbi:MAG: serine hydrolase [Pseudomonadota bacterium]